MTLDITSILSLWSRHHQTGSVMCHVLSRCFSHVTSCYVMLQAIMMFSVCGSRTEMMGDRHNAYSMYIETLSLIKFLTKLTNSSRNNNQDVDPRYRIAAKSWIPFMFCIFRLVVLSLRAQSLLNLKLYKMKRHELKDYQKTIQDVLAKSEEDPSTSSEGQSRTEQMSTPSPAGSEGSNCSKVSKYIFFMF